MKVSVSDAVGPSFYCGHDDISLVRAQIVIAGP
jgi:hypothetical protein